MPARSKAQQELMAIAEHHPSQVSKKNRGVLKMSHQQLHDFAATKRKGLPMRAPSAKAVKVAVPPEEESDPLAPSRGQQSRARQSVRTGKASTKSSFPKQKAAKGQTNAYSFRTQTKPIKVPKAGAAY
jgi:hypothetical protein